MWGDGAYDSEAWHAANRDEWGVPSFAPTTVRSPDGSVSGLYRRAFADMRPAGYNRWWVCERVNSAIKRISGPSLRGRCETTLFNEAALKVAAYAIKV